MPGNRLRIARLALLTAPLALAAALAATLPARADLRVCNQTANPISIALGYRAERGWQSEGWWVAGPAQCATVYRGELNARFFYLYAADDIGGGAWDGSVFMCTRDDSFTIFSVEDCLARGYERTGFFEVDTQNKSDWTLQLTDPMAGGPQGSDADLPDDAAAEAAPLEDGDATGDAALEDDAADGSDPAAPDADPASQGSQTE